MARGRGAPKYPEEFYGVLVTRETAASFPPILEREHCPFLNTRCVKQRKSDARQTIGACTVGFQNSPHVICPHRFLQGNHIFRDVQYLLRPAEEYRIVPEMKMPGGNIDYFLVAMSGHQVVDYLGLEIQALDTTGSGGIWTARQDLARGFLGQTYKYGINWKMSAKTILVQLFHKAASFDALGKKFVLTIQREFFDYLQNEFQMEQLRPAVATDVFHLHSYSVTLTPGGLSLQMDGQWSTNLVGVEQMLSQGTGEEILEDDVIQRITDRLPRSRGLDEDIPLIVAPVSEDGVKADDQDADEGA